MNSTCTESRISIVAHRPSHASSSPMEIPDAFIDPQLGHLTTGSNERTSTLYVCVDLRTETKP